MKKENNSILFHFHNLIGLEGTYEGADEQELVFKFDNILWQAKEDDMDGYRSMLDYVVYADNSTQRKFISHKNLAKVVLESIDNTETGGHFAGYILKDITDDHIWLKIGTSYIDEWYPCVIFQHNPKVNNV
jgi:hypothetical protein